MSRLDPGIPADDLLENVPVAVLVVDLDTRILLLNREAERLYGYPTAELHGEPVQRLLPEQEWGQVPVLRDRLLAEPVGWTLRGVTGLAGRRKDGSTFPVEFTARVVDGPAGPVIAVAACDITERLREEAERDRLRDEAAQERAERKALQTQRMEALGQLAGGVAHDFNNLLGIVINYAAFVAEEVAELGRGPEAERWQAVGRDIGQIQRAAERATELTQRLLAFGRREVARPRVLDVDDVLRDVEQMLLRTLGEHIKIDIRPAGTLWRTLADPAQLEQVVVNLAVNARDAMPGGGLLVIDTANVTIEPDGSAEVAEVPPGRYVRLRVSDTGVGMPPAVVQRAFEPFFTTKPIGAGTGLGLATVHGIVTAAGGHVWIYSESGQGTAISVLLPATERHPAAAIQPAQPVSAPGHETVLLVEDQDALRKSVGRILQRAGYGVLAAADAADALCLASDHDGPIHLLLTDVVMPQMLGKEVAESVAALVPSVRVIFMSGYAQPVLAAQGTLDPGATLVEKPFSATTLLATVRRILDG